MTEMILIGNDGSTISLAGALVGPAGADGVDGAGVESGGNEGEFLLKVPANVSGTDWFDVNIQFAANPDMIIAGAVTRDGNEAATAAPVVWPDGTTGDYTATTVSTDFPGAIDAYEITYDGNDGTRTYTQPAVTRNAAGAVTLRPAITVS